MSKIITKQLVYDKDHHVHHLEGFYIKGRFFSIDVVETKTKTTADHKCNIYIDQNFGEHINSALKTWIRSDHPTNSGVDLYVRFTPAEQTISSHKHRGGAVQHFPLDDGPGAAETDCDSIQTFTLSPPFVPRYTVPSIEYIRMLNKPIYEELLQMHQITPRGNEFAADMALVTKENYENGSYKTILILDHLYDTQIVQKNRWVHNGIYGKDLVDSIIARIRGTGNTYLTAQLIHSILHVYDALYITDQSRTRYGELLDCLHTYDDLVPDPMEDYCLFKLLNRHAGDFLFRSPDTGLFQLPYGMIEEALLAKGEIYEQSLGVMLSSFQDQLFEEDLQGQPLPATGETDRLPNTYIMPDN